MHTLLIVDDEEIERAGMAQFIRDHGRLEEQCHNKHSPALVKEKPKRGCILMKEKGRENQVTDSVQTVLP